ncbi:hypothetical protein SteCoe_21041 [Stentor coeruleus]|uniref:FHA domain-containing protein n=1 Tax=Stentor coeruleus TaxID=5963 RepID=A0A1R2BQD7_9CILI|nr:hypothetical protein SteCoe_21041 [Stentor coeruleus]
MTCEFSNLRARLKEEYNRNRFGEDINKRIRSLSSQILRIQDLNTDNTKLGKLVEIYEKLFNTFNTSKKGQLIKRITSTEDEILSLILTKLIIPSNHFVKYLRAARKESLQQSLDQILPKFLTIYVHAIIVNSLPKTTEVTLFDFFTYITKVFIAFNFPINKFTKSIAKKYLCGAWNPDKFCKVKLNSFKESLEIFFSKFFGSIKNYRFYVKVNKIYSEFLENLDLERTDKRMIIIPTTVRKDYQGVQTIKLNKEYIIEPMGMYDQENFRDDGMVLFGRHPDSDFVFPEDKSFVDQVSMIMYNVNNNLYLIDCSERSYCGIKIEYGKNIAFKEGALMNLSKSMLFRIDKIEYEKITNHYNASDQINEYEIEDTRMHSTIYFSCLEGLYKDINFKISTKVKNSDQIKNFFSFGFGIEDQSPDIFIPRETGISHRHCEFRYDNENNWFLYDEKSTNGTFFLMKTYEELNSKVHSRVIQLFENNNPENFAVIMINRYTFSVRKFKEDTFNLG